MRLHVQVRGQGFPILCLHGHPGSGQSMTVFTDHLARCYRTLAPDLRGYGQSRTREAFAMEDHLNDLTQLLDEQGIDECLVLGWSLGGILAMELALRQPERIKGLILVATAARPWGNHPPISWQDNLYTGVASILNRVQPGQDWVIETFGKRSLYRHLIQQHTPAAYQRLAAEALPAYLQTSPHAHRALNQALRQRYNRLAAIAQLPIPCLMLWGECDRHITPESSRETAQHFQNCHSHQYAKVAHLFPWEIPDQVLADIDRWLNQTFA
ncbi:MAG: alpha/beta hydrolase [Cyanobacteria bacterium Co-bin13]|nr:alpha/beta hydrolase [Cyanobacteria bacterium Co-bin13]